MCLGIPGVVRELLDSDTTRLAIVDVKGSPRTVNLELLDDDVAPGDWVIIHMGYALERTSEFETRDPQAGIEVAG